ncbi:hypothetical protein JHK84_044042 [Glycine max]|nr:hypothetical protein JHK84_044042 [Glycine max]
MYFISLFDFWVLSVQKIEFFCVPQFYLTMVEYSSSFARQKPYIIVCWIDYRSVFPPRLLLHSLFTSFCICMRFFYFGILFFHCMVIVSSKVAIFFSKKLRFLGSVGTKY